MKSLFLISILLLIAITPAAFADPGDKLFTINNPTPEESDEFGWSISTTPNGDILVGTPYDNTVARDSGSAYLFDGNDGSLLLTLNNPTPQESDFFGTSLATTDTGDLLVSAYNDDTGADNTGAVYLFDGDTGALLLTINNPTPQEDDYFGWSVATTDIGDILIGAYGDNTGALSSGSVYLFNGTDGTLLHTINNPTPEENDHFGYAIAATNNGDILVGAPWDNTDGPSAGFAYLFNGDTGELLLEINNPRAEHYGEFGTSVASTPNGNLLVGAHKGETYTGSVYLFHGTYASLLFIIDNPAANQNNSFGISVVTTNNGDLLVAAPKDNTDSAYLFNGDNGVLLLIIKNPAPSSLNQFGTSVASTPYGEILVGAPLDNIGTSDVGSVYLFEGPLPTEIPEPPIFTDNKFGVILLILVIVMAVILYTWMKKKKN